MEFLWLKSYPPGVPARIDCDAHASLVQLIDATIARYSRCAAYVCMGAVLTYAELGQRAAQLAGYFQSELGLSRGDRVALMLPNLLQYPVALVAALRAGCTVVNCNPLHTARELEKQLADSGATTIVVLENFAHVVQQALPATQVKHVIVTGLGDMLGLFKGVAVNAVVRHVKKLVPPWRIDGALSWRQALGRGRQVDYVRIDLTRDDLAFLQYTGGTTGTAKAAMLSHGNILANLQQIGVWVAADLVPGEEVVITALPLSHIFALTASLTFLQLGAKNVLIPNPRDLPAFVKVLANEPFSVITGVNTLFNALLNRSDFRRLSFPRLKVSLGGGMALQQAVAERWQQLTGCALIEAYGLTEAAPGVAINPLTLPAFNGSIGLPLPSTEVAIRDDAGNDLPSGEAGELCVRGPQVMRGYWNRPEETAAILLPDGFLRTGDVAVMDEDGFLRIVDRKKDMIIVSGYNVYPNEVEAVVVTHPGVFEAALVGVPDRHTGEALKLYVVKRDASLGVGELIAHCRQNLAAYKVPHRIEFRDELPKTNVGKILRRALRDGKLD